MKTFLEPLVAQIRFRIWKLKIRGRNYLRCFDWDKIIWMDPGKIKYCCTLGGLNERFNPEYNTNDFGKLLGGGWDRKKKLFEELDVFKAFKARFKDGNDWPDTEFYQQIMSDISRGRISWCRNKTDLDARCRYLDSLYHKIKEGGCRECREAIGAEKSPWKILDEVTVCIGRDGELLFEDGRHRLSVSKILGIKKIPVRITLRHSKWYRLRKEIIGYAKRNYKGKIYHPITHPDLGDIPSHHGGRRFEIIRQHLPRRGGDVLDIGAHWGYFCHKLEEEGFNCYAIENDPQNLYFLRKLRKAEDRRFRIIGKSIFEYRDKTDFDVVLALNIFHHFLKEKDTYYRLIELLERIKTKLLFFEPHHPEESQMERAYRNYNHSEFVNFILEHSGLKKVKLIGKAEDGRPIYKLYN